MVNVAVLTPDWPVAVVFQGSWDPVVDTTLEAVDVALTTPELQTAEPEDAVPEDAVPEGAVLVRVWIIVVKFCVNVIVDSVT